MADVIAINTKLKIPQKAKEPEKCVAKKPARSKKPVRPRYDPKKGLFDKGVGQIVIRRMPYTSPIFKYPSLLKTLIAICGSVSPDCLVVPRRYLKGAADRYQPGSMLFNLRKIAKFLQVPYTTLRQDLTDLETMGFIRIQKRKDTVGLIVTVARWEPMYQAPEEKSNEK